MKDLINSIEKYESVFEQCATQVLETAKLDCATYSEVTKTLKKAKCDLLWSGHPTGIAVIDRAVEMLEEEKSHLPVTSSPLC